MKNKINYFIVFFSVLCLNVAFSQTFKKYYGGKNTEYGNSLAITADGNFVVVGSSNSSGNKQIYMLKIDTKGNELWDAGFGGKNFEEGTCVKYTSDKGFIICGITKSFKDNYDGDVYLIKTDSMGKEQWSKLYGGEKMEIGNSVIQYPDGGYVIVGNSKTEDRSIDIYVVKTDEKGTEQWHKSFSATGTYDAEGTGVCLTENGSIIVGGAIQNAKGYNDLLIKIGMGKDSSWQKSSGGQESNHMRAVKSCKDKGIIFCGTIGGGTGNAFIMKTDSKGKKIWAKSIGIPSGSEVFNDVIETSDNSYVAVGSNNSKGNGKNDVFIVKFDSKGNMVWERYLGTPADDYGSSILETKDGGFVIAGTSLNDPLAAEQILIYKTNSKGEIDP